MPYDYGMNLADLMEKYMKKNRCPCRDEMPEYFSISVNLMTETDEMWKPSNNIGLLLFVANYLKVELANETTNIVDCDYLQISRVLNIEHLVGIIRSLNIGNYIVPLDKHTRIRFVIRDIKCYWP